MAFWSGDKIKIEFPARKIVSNFQEKQINESAYQLSLGAECFVTPDHDIKLRDSYKRNLGEEYKIFRPMKLPESVSIPPGHFAYLVTHEDLDIPDNIMGFISMRAKYKLNGLINVSGFHVDPGFRGKLVFGVYNAGPSTVTLSLGDPLFLIWIADLDDKASVDYSRRSKPPKTQIDNKLIDHMNQPIHSIQSLSNKIDDLENSIKLIRNTFYVVGVLTTLVIAAIGLAYRVWVPISSGVGS